MLANYLRSYPLCLAVFFSYPPCTLPSLLTSQPSRCYCAISRRKPLSLFLSQSSNDLVTIVESSLPFKPPSFLRMRSKKIEESEII
ncbi:hypothetical protein LINGRAHAP2_LOCUS14850 [Linum grandiflorum]